MDEEIEKIEKKDVEVIKESNDNVMDYDELYDQQLQENEMLRRQLSDLKNENKVYFEKMKEYEDLIVNMNSTISTQNNLITHYRLISEIYYLDLTSKKNNDNE